MGRLFSYMGMSRKPKIFRPSHQPTRQEVKREADARRGSAASRGYNERWRKARVTHLACSPLCIGCLAIGRYVAAEIVDHVDPHHGDSEKFWDTSMWQSCCKWHHDVVKQRLEDQYAQGRLGLAALKLDSPEATRMTRAMDPVAG